MNALLNAKQLTVAPPKTFVLALFFFLAQTISMRNFPALAAQTKGINPRYYERRLKTGVRPQRLSEF